LKNLRFKNSYLLLGEAFYHKCKPSPVAEPELIALNRPLATSLDIDVETTDQAFLTDIFSGNKVHQSCQPLAMAYAGHQFGNFNPQLGDGRAIYLGEIELADGSTSDLQLKGSGPTRYSRNGDGRAALGPVLREYLLSEAMFCLNVPTTRALAAVTTGEQVARERYLPGAVITRVASSFIRVGSFEYFARQGDQLSVKKLADYMIGRNYPQTAEAERPYLAFFEAVVLRQARLIAKWMQLGFIHGVMNTDNMSVAGETIDYGPCAFMDYFNHRQVYSSIDRQGRYAYTMQPDIGLWNLSRLAESLLPLFAAEPETAVKLAQDILQSYLNAYASEWLAGFRDKCGLTAVSAVTAADDKALLEALLDIMADNKADFTLTFYYLSKLDADVTDKDSALLSLFSDHSAINGWLQNWRQRLMLEKHSDRERQCAMQQVNPVYIPRNHQIEAVIKAAQDNNDFTPFHSLYEVLQKPFEYQPGREQYSQPPSPQQVVLQTFCGT